MPAISARIAAVDAKALAYIGENVLQEIVFPFFFGIRRRIDVPRILALDRYGDKLIALQIARQVGVRLKTAVMPRESMQQVKHGIAIFSDEIIFRQVYPILHFSLQGLAEKLYVLDALVALCLRRRSRRDCRRSYG